MYLSVDVSVRIAFAFVYISIYIYIYISSTGALSIYSYANCHRFDTVSCHYHNYYAPTKMYLKEREKSKNALYQHVSHTIQIKEIVEKRRERGKERGERERERERDCMNET